MIRHFLLDKTNTIIKGSLANMGMNPVMQITYGDAICRGLVHFSDEDIKNWIEEEGIDIDNEKLTFKLHMTNCFSVDSLPYEKEIVSVPGKLAERAASFNLDFFELEHSFDQGRGYEYDSDFCIEKEKAYSVNGSNWEYSSGVTKWTKLGAYTKDSEIIVSQHFDFGKENIDVDITDYIKACINGEKENNGIGIKISADQESELTDKEQYVGFFTDHTNTFFHPYVEAIYDDPIQDDRENFYNGRTNRLYLYVNSDGERVKLDENPICMVDDASYPVKCAGKGVYYAEICLNVDGCNDMPIKYDVWSNIKVNGQDFGEVEQEFVVLPANLGMQIGSISSFKDMTVPSIYGIDDNEELHLDEVREVTVDFRKKYTTDKKELSHNSEYRLYIKDGRREYDVFPYTKIERGFLNNFFVLHTDDLVPGKYYIDIKDSCGRETRYYKDVLHFIVKDDVTERYY